ncbi:hypothetical protein NPIL_204511 [Nephila pilipes]|uniref:Uncharacterized protein n=1 Tax=Nephila pilipes TaxID=299642 RepID=A0A8X6PFG8_NEPPI|nr:hypothetical protein NPIL_204511 [Nephila pilipes]
MNERLRILKIQHEDAYSHVCHIESRYMDRESSIYLESPYAPSIKERMDFTWQPRKQQKRQRVSISLFLNAPYQAAPYTHNFQSLLKKGQKQLILIMKVSKPHQLENKQKEKLLSYVFLK